MIGPLLLALAAVAAGAPPPDGQAQAPGRGGWQLTVSALAVVIAGEPQQNGPLRDPHRGDWQQAYAGRRDGSLLPLREIERRVLPTMPGAQYLGVEMDEPPIYTLKFLRDGVVIWVDVDGRSGQIVRRTGR